MGGGRGTGLNFGLTLGSREVAALRGGVQLCLGIAAGDASFMGPGDAFPRDVRSGRDVDPGGIRSCRPWHDTWCSSRAPRLDARH